MLKEMGMKVFSSLFFLFSLIGSAGAGTPTVGADGPEMAAGVVGMTLAAGLVYLIRRRKRS
jgi:LPXTG-motif cell wall-anchored protein